MDYEQNPYSTPQVKKDTGVGPVFGSIIIIILIVLGGLYFWGYIVNERQETPKSSDYNTNPSAEVEIKTE